MNKIIYSFVFILIAGISLNCSSGKRSLEKGKYSKATREAVKQLKSNPNNKKAAKVLIQSYPLAKQDALRKINDAMAFNSPDRYSIAADEYIALNDLADLIHGSPKAIQLIGQPTSFARELGDMLPKAAEEKYNQAELLMKSGDIMDALQAYYAYKKADEYVRGYRDVGQKINISLDAATLKVVVEKPQTPSRYQLTSDFFYDNLMSEMNKFSKNRFVRFYNWKETGEGNLIRPDQYMILDFEDFSVGNFYESTDRYEAVKDSVVTGRTQVNGQTVDVYGKVRANVTLHKQEMISQGLLSVKVINSDNTRILENKRFPGQFVWGNQWLTYNGDERALNDEEYKLSKGGPLPPPPSQNLFIEFTKPIFDQTMDFVKRYYSNY